MDFTFSDCNGELESFSRTVAARIENLKDVSFERSFL